jgi:hypothetical protein
VVHLGHGCVERLVEVEEGEDEPAIDQETAVDMLNKALAELPQ